jgi:hypothetical protein
MGKDWLYYVIIAKKHRFWLKVTPKSNYKLKNYKKCPSLVGEACEDKPNRRLYRQTLAKHKYTNHTKYNNTKNFRKLKAKIIDMENLDKQLSVYNTYLKNEVGITNNDLNKISSKIENEINCLTKEEIEKFIDKSPIDLNHRYDELTAFQMMMDYIRINQITDPGLIRSQVINQNYICFVYLQDSYFKALQDGTQINSITYRCCNFLTSSRIRKFRNSIAHGSWCYKDDYSGLEYWDYLNGKKKNGYENFEVNQEELSFWQTLSRVVAYTTIETIRLKLKE